MVVSWGYDDISNMEKYGDRIISNMQKKIIENMRIY
jgi:hypothetical protein